MSATAERGRAAAATGHGRSRCCAHAPLGWPSEGAKRRDTQHSTVRHGLAYPSIDWRGFPCASAVTRARSQACCACLASHAQQAARTSACCGHSRIRPPTHGADQPRPIDHGTHTCIGRDMCVCAAQHSRARLSHGHMAAARWRAGGHSTARSAPS